jgi:hypothetical protein
VNAGVLLNPFKQAIAYTSDFRLAPRLSVDAGLGYFFNSINFANTSGESYQGLRLRYGLKYALPSIEKTAFYVGVEGKYQYIRHISNKEVLRQGAQYLEILSVERNVRTNGLALRTGWYHYVSKNKRWMIEQYVGLGINFHQVRHLLPPDAELAETERFLSFEIPDGKSNRAAFLLGLHIGYLLW